MKEEKFLCDEEILKWLTEKNLSGIIKGKLLYLYETHSVSTWTDVRCWRRVYGEYQRCRGRGRGRICSESH